MRKIYLLLIVFLMGLGLSTSCTDKFEEYNTEPYAPTELDASLLFYNLIDPSLFVQINNHQHTEQMIGLDYGGYLSMTNAWTHMTFGSYNPNDGWIEKTYSDIFSRFYANFFKVEKATKKEGHFYAFALLLKVSAMHRLVDTFGPIPYSKVKNGVSQPEFDSVEEVYKHMFEDLNFAIQGLGEFVKANPTFKPMEGKDIIFNGDYSKWLKYANSLKLRLAMRMANVDPTNAQKYAEEAVASSYGLISTNADNAYRKLESMTNPYNGIAVYWGDSRINATIASYMNGYEDPRRESYFTISTFTDPNIQNGYIGVRAGNNRINKNASVFYSMPNFGPKQDVCLFRAAETAFLKAEGALRGWNMGGDVQKLYEDAVAVSFDEYGLSSKLQDYLNDETKVPSDYNNPQSIGNYNVHSKITIKWKEADAFERKLERIITQKWIANYPLGYEGWADFRRTGYPEIFPALNNLSNGTVNDVRRARRVSYPSIEYKTNKDNVEYAVTNLLGGPDNMGTDLWWAKKN